MNKTPWLVAGIVAIALNPGWANGNEAGDKSFGTMAEQSRSTEERVIAAACARERADERNPRCNELAPPIEYDKFEGGAELHDAVRRNVETAHALISEAMRSGVQSREDGSELMKIVATLPPRELDETMAMYIQAIKQGKIKPLEPFLLMQ
jgi:hypothetical protein